MRVTQCLMALIALCVGLAHSWDVVVGVGDQLIFYTDGTQTRTETLLSRNLTALAYDEVNDVMLYVDKQSNNDTICGFNLHSKENKCFIERNGRNIQAIVLEPVTQTLFFTDTNDNTINWISLKPGSVNNVHGNLLIKTDDRAPGDIAVDSCKRYIYWVNNKLKKNYTNGILERARFNGSEREIITRELLKWEVLTLDIDSLNRKMYYMDGFNKDYYYKNSYLNSAVLGRKSEVIVYNIEKGYYSAAKELTVSKDYFYWVNSSESNNLFWQIPKNGTKSKQPEKLGIFSTENSLAIAINYKIEDLMQGLQDCEDLSSLIPAVTITNNSLNIDQSTETEPTTEYTTDVGLFCVHGEYVSETSACKCTPGYIGERCDVSVCQNYCLHGNCSFNDEGLPTCSCDAGYTGERCEVSVCYNRYCLNDGTCSLNKNSEPVCECRGNYTGDRCEVSDCLNYCIHGNCSFNEEGLPTCRCNASYSGERCELYACHGYCLNNGDCSLNKEGEPVCQCAGNHEGLRCEAVKYVTCTTNNTSTYYSAKGNLTLADLLANWRKPTARVTVTVEV